MTRYIKNGKFFDGHLRIGDKIVVSPSHSQLISQGWKVYKEPNKTIKPTKKVIKFSQFKIIEVLGDKWGALKAQLEEKGLYDYFMAAPYLSTGNEVFLEFYKTLSTEQKKLLYKYCKY